MQVFIVSLLFIGIIMILIGFMILQDTDKINDLIIKTPKLIITDDNLSDQILQQQFSTSEQDSILESQFTGPTVTDIFGDQFDQGALFSHGFILGTDLKPLHETDIV
jgi:hypothetical protein